MSKLLIALMVLVSVGAGFGGAFVYELTLGKSQTGTSKATTTTTTAKTETTEAKSQTLEECLTEVWGKDKYAAISANSSLATTDDNLASLKCYK